MHRTAWHALAKVVSTAVAFCAVTLLVFFAFYAAPNQSRFSRRGSRHYNERSLHAYLDYVWRFLRHGDLGTSFSSREPVMTRLVRAAPVTLSLLLGGLVIAALFAVVPLLRPRHRVDRGLALFAVAGISVHPVSLSLVISWLFGAHWHVVAAQGYCGVTSASTGCSGVTHWFSHLVLPWIVLGLATGAYFSLAVRALLHGELEEDYVREARAKGAGEQRIVRAHVLRNLAPSLTALWVMNLGVTFSAVIFIETIFDLPGLGATFRRSLLQHDLPMTAGVVLLVTAAILALSLLADLALYASAIGRPTTSTSSSSAVSAA